MNTESIPTPNKVSPVDRFVSRTTAEFQGWPWVRIAALVVLSATGFHLAFAVSSLAWLIVLLPFGLIGLSQLPKWRMAFYGGIAVGLCCYAPRLIFFWTIFKAAAIPLWVILSLWLGFFAVLLRFVSLRLLSGHSRAWLLLVAPVIWTALEFFRSELYWLRFAWLTPGMAFDQWPGVVSAVGSYGIGFVAAVLAAGASPLLHSPLRVSSTSPSLGALLAAVLCASANPAAAKSVQIAGAQLEFPTHDEVLATLNKLVARYPKTELIVLSEYTFDDAPPKSVLKWCRDHRRYLIAGGKGHLPDGNFYNTAFVVSRDGEIVFKQAKKQPIQFFKDGKPAPTQQLWLSPWGPIGIAICYDFSYSRVIDELVRQGAQALVIPTMDVVDWGQTQHETHGRLGPIRAAEYGIPVVRVCSSGNSQIVSASGRVEHTMPFDGQGEMFGAPLTLTNAGHLPADRWLVRGCIAASALLFLASFLTPLRPKTDWTATPPLPPSNP